ncbi:MAG TPA: TlpA disulfide reductase family protein [Terriglobia bacterium]|nr:TlpA disulfide reductase family protein [Terriglobia bacterium]
MRRPTRPSTIAPGVCGLLALVASGAAMAGRGSQPQLQLWDTSMKPQSLGQYRGKIVILNFWATWCENCKTELPMLVEEEKRYKDRGVVVIGASLDDRTTVKRVRPFAKAEKLNFPVWVGATVDHLQQLGLGQAIPATAFFDREGNLVGRVLGVLRQDDLEHRIEWMLGNQQGAPPEALVDNVNPH